MGYSEHVQFRAGQGNPGAREMRARRGRGRRVARSARAYEVAGRFGIQRPTDRMKSCWPTRRSTRSTTRCPTTCMCPGRSRRWRPAKHVLSREADRDSRRLRRRSARRGEEAFAAQGDGGLYVPPPPAMGAREAALSYRAGSASCGRSTRSSLTSTTTPATFATWPRSAAAG